ncbi:MAG: MG2 domain-containing protein [Anaerolineae bacterium]|nr:MG2 domain-containing protein [Anaerolineae bacterium]MDW8069589.1 MG2 domain-containing protein [Anaerolineae bacterium]
MSPRRMLSLFLLSVLLITACRAPRPATPASPLAPPSSPPPTPGPAPPTLLEFPPPADTRNPRLPIIRLAFSRPMDPRSVLRALSVEPTAPLAVYSQEDDALLLRPTAPLTPGQVYQFTLTSTATDRDGIPLDQVYRWTYDLPRLATLSGPSREQKEVPLTIRFHYKVSPESARKAVRMEPAVGGEWQWDAGQNALVFHPQESLPAGATLTISLSADLCDPEGIPFPPPEPLFWTIPLPILDIHPSANLTVPPATFVRIVFDRPMNWESVVAAFSITPTVAGRFHWEETTLIFRPKEPLMPQTIYTVTLAPSALDEDGQPILSSPYTWAFQTGAPQPVADFGWGPNAQVLDADGRRAVHFRIYSLVDTALTFELYRVTLPQFLDRYASGFRGVAGREKRPISLEGATLTRRWEAPARNEQQWDAPGEVIIPADVPPGLYILNMQAPAAGLTDQLFLILTRHVLTLKQAEGQIVAWLTDINGGPVPDAEVGIYARDGTLVAQGTTDDLGVYRTRVPRDPQPLIVVARVGEDLTAAGLSNEWRSPSGSWRRWWQLAPAARRYAAYIYTDRPIYRPGQTVFFKAILRRDDDAVLSRPPVGTPVTVRIRDARNNVVQTFNLTTSEFGTLSGQFSLAEGAMLGNYAVEVIVDGEAHRQVFKVQDYRKPDYQVQVTPERTRYVAGETMTVTVESRYFFGEPVAGARAVVKIYQLGQRYCWEDCADKERYVWYASDRPPIQVTTDADGRFTFTLPAEYRSDYRWWETAPRTLWGLEATVDDGSHQTVSGFAVVEVYPTAERLSLDPGGYLHAPGQPFTVQMTVRTIFDEPVPNRAVRLELVRWSQDTGDYTDVVQAITVTTKSDGTVRTPFTAEKPGWYQLRAVATDRLGHEMKADCWLAVFRQTWWGEQAPAQLRILADQDRYAPGDVARLLIESSISGPALLTFERGTTRRAQVVHLTPPITVVDVPIQPDDVPNIHVTVNVWEPQDTTFGPKSRAFSISDSTLRTASVELAVPAEDRRLTVAITPDRTRYAPRQEARFTVRVTDAQGAPVPGAEVSLALVDEAIFALSEELSGPIHDAFYYRRANIVRTYDGMALRRYLGEDWGRGGGGEGGFTAANPRSDFPDTAIWLPALTTDANGTVVLTLHLPDSLTTWRLTAKVTTAEDQVRVGEAVAKVTTHQPIVVRPLLPRALTAGDQFYLSTAVHNYSPSAQSLTVGLRWEGGLEVARPLTQALTLAPGEVRIVGWSARATAPGTVTVTVSARAATAGDAVRLSMPVRPLAVREVQTQVGQFQGLWETTVFLPTDALRPVSTLEVYLSRSVAGNILVGLEYLTGYPFGCVEQTMSKALPTAVVARAFHQLGYATPTLLADLPPKVQAGLQRLYGFQHNDGGWGWWWDDASHDYQTAWVIFGLAMIAQAGYEVDSGVIQRGVDWLNSHLEGMDIRTRAYALYSMAIAGKGNRAATLALFEERKQLDFFSQAALVLALHELGEAGRARTLADELAERATLTPEGAWWAGESYDGYYHQKTMASVTRTTAMALDALVRVRPDHPLIPQAVRWLMAQRRTDGWGTTNETAYSIIALTDYLLALEEQTADTTCRVEVNGTTVHEGRLGRGEPVVSLKIPATRLRTGQNRLRLACDGGGTLYYVVNSRLQLARERVEAAGDVRVDRVYRDAETKEVITTARPGQLVQVELRVQMPKTGTYIIVEDPLPGGLEALNERLNTTSHDAVAQEERFYWREYGYNQKEVWGDRVVFFVTEMSGEWRVTYLARAVRSGRFVALPTEVSGMYHPTVWGRSASQIFVVAQD